MIRFKLSTIALISLIGLVWILCARFFNSGSSEAFYSEQKYHEDVSRIYHDLGTLSQKRGDLKQATRFFKHAVQTDASFLKPYEALEVTYKLRKKNAKALLIHQRAATLQSRLCKQDK